MHIHGIDITGSQVTVRVRCILEMTTAVMAVRMLILWLWIQLLE